MNFAERLYNGFREKITFGTRPGYTEKALEFDNATLQRSETLAAITGIPRGRNRIARFITDAIEYYWDILKHQSNSRTIIPFTDSELAAFLPLIPEGRKIYYLKNVIPPDQRERAKALFSA
jgi:hypothetical protein